MMEIYHTYVPIIPPKWITLLFVLYVSIINITIVTGNEIIDSGRTSAKPSYLISMPNRVRPGQILNVAVNVLSVQAGSMSVRATVRRFNEELATATATFERPTFSMLQLRIPEGASEGKYKLRLEGSVGFTLPGGLFSNETDLEYFPKRVSVFIQPSKYIYCKKDTMQFRIMAVHPNLIPVATGTVTVFLIDGRGNIMRRWFQLQLINGLVELEYKMSHPIRYNYFTIRVEGWGHKYEEKVWGQNFYPERLNVNITIPPWIKEQEFGLAGLVQANLTKGYAVKGNATIQLEIQPPGKTEDFPKITREVSLFTGAISFLFTMDEIKQHTDKLVGTKLTVIAKVKDWHGLDDRTVKANSFIHSSDFMFKFIGGEVRTFKPGSAFPVQVAVYGSDGCMFNRTTHKQVSFERSHTSTTESTWNVPEERVLISPDSIARLTFVPRDDDKIIRVRAKYLAMDGSTSFKELVAHRHYTKSNHYIHIASSTHNPQANEYMVFTVRTTTYIPEIYYQISASSNIMLVNTLFMKATQKTFSVALSRDMVPSARIMVYALLNNGEVLADSLNFHVKGIMSQGIDVRVNKGKDFSLDTVELIGETNPGTLTMFAGQQYDLYNKGMHHFLTQQKVEEELATYDSNANSSFRHTWYLPEYRRENIHFSAPSVAIDANMTFAFAGLLVFTDANLVRHPAAYECNDTRGYLPCHDGGCYELARKCDTVRDCSDGADELGCPDTENLEPPDQIKQFSMMDYHVIESAKWLWKSHFSRPNSMIQFTSDVPHRPTTWLVQGIALSTINGMSFTETPARIDTTRPFYIEVEMPKKAIKGEMIGVQVTVFNYWDQPLETLVTLFGDDDYRFVNVEDFGVVSSYNPRLSSGDHQTMVYLEAGTSKLIHFPVLPMKLGKTNIRIEGLSFIARRTVKKSVTVKTPGITNMYHTPYFIDLVNKGSQLIPDLYIPIPEMFKMPEEYRHLYVPGSQEARVSVVGDVAGPGYWTSDLHTENQMNLKTGNSENYIYNFAVNLYWMRFLEASHQLTDKWEAWSLKALNKYYPNVVAHRMASGAMSSWRSKAPPSIWCTMLCLQVMNDAADPKREYDIFIDPDYVNAMALWLVGQQNMTSGAWSEISEIYDMKLMTNGTLGPSRSEQSNVSLTAHGIIAFQNNGRLTGVVKGMADSAKNLAADYLGKKLHTLTDPFEICIVAYALHLAGHKKKADAFKMMVNAKIKDQPYWSREEIPEMKHEILSNIFYLYHKPETAGCTVAVEATSYALMTYLINNRIREAEPIMEWLQTQRNYDSAFSSSQDSLVALQALTEFSKSDTNRALYKMFVNLESTASPKWGEQVKLERGKFITYHETTVPIAHGSVRSSVAGTGRALLQMTTNVNVEFDDQLRQPPNKSFDLTIEKFTSSGRNASRFDMMVCARWLRPDIAPHASYTIMQFDIPTGFHVHKKDLRLLQKRNRLLMRVRFTGGQVVLYFERVPSIKTCVDFYAFRWFPVSNMSIQHQIRLYNFYEPTYRNYTIYNAWDQFHNHICQVCGSFQCPYCPYYNTGHPASPLTLTLYILTLTTVIVLVKNKLMLAVIQ